LTIIVVTCIIVAILFSFNLVHINVAFPDDIRLVVSIAKNLLLGLPLGVHMLKDLSQLLTVRVPFVHICYLLLGSTLLLSFTFALFIGGQIVNDEVVMVAEEDQR
jgi:drug/metabolite transporter (DMT)-like permease